MKKNLSNLLNRTHLNLRLRTRLEKMINVEAIDKIDLRGLNVSKQELQVVFNLIDKMSGLTQIAIEGDSLGDQDLQELLNLCRKLTTLEVVYIKFAHLTDKGAQRFAEYIQDYIGLKTIYFHGDDITDKGIESMTNAVYKNPSINGLSLGGEKIHNSEALKFIVQLLRNKRLEQFSLALRHLSRANTLALGLAIANSHSLKTLDIFVEEIESEQLLIAHIKDNTSLTEILYENKTNTPEQNEKIESELSKVAVANKDRLSSLSSASI